MFIQVVRWDPFCYQAHSNCLQTQLFSLSIISVNTARVSTVTTVICHSHNTPHSHSVNKTKPHKQTSLNPHKTRKKNPLIKIILLGYKLLTSFLCNKWHGTGHHTGRDNALYPQGWLHHQRAYSSPFLRLHTRAQSTNIIPLIILFFLCYLSQDLVCCTWTDFAFFYMGL